MTHGKAVRSYRNGATINSPNPNRGQNTWDREVQTRSLNLLILRLFYNLVHKVGLRFNCARPRS